VLVFPSCVGLPNRDAESIAPPPRLAPQCIVRIDVHGPPDRAKDASSSASDDLSCLRRAYALWRRRTAFPSSAPFGHPLSLVRACRGRMPGACDGPTKTVLPTTPREERRFPDHQDAFHRHDTRRSLCHERIAPSAFAPALPLTPPALCPPAGKVLLMGIARSRCGHPRIRESREYERLFDSLDFRAWD
jgi:hypothetical protein